MQLSAPGRPCPDQEFDVLAEAADNAGRWGTEDALGALNLITAAVARQAATEVRDGLTLSLAWPFAPARLTLSWPSADAVVDEAVVAPHGETITHLDAPGHIYLHGRSYNNTAPDTNRDRLSRQVDITVGAAGVVTRASYSMWSCSWGHVHRSAPTCTAPISRRPLSLRTSR